MSEKIRVEVELAGDEQVKNQLKGIVDSINGNAANLSSAFSRVGEIIDRLGIRSLGVSGNIARIAVDLNEAALAGANTSTAFARLGGEMGGVTGTAVVFSGLLASSAIRLVAIGAAAATAAAGLLKLGSSAGESAAKLGDAARAADLSIAAFQKYALATKMLGLPPETINGFAKLKDFFQQTADKSADSALKIRELNNQLAELGRKEALAKTALDAQKFAIQIEGVKDQLAKLQGDNTGIRNIGLDFKYLSSNAVSAEEAFIALSQRLAELKASGSSQYTKVLDELTAKLGPDFVRLLETSGAAISRWSNLINQTAGALGEDSVQIGNELRSVDGFLTEAISRINQRVGLAFTPATIQGKLTLINFLRDNKQAIDGFVGYLASVGSTIKSFFQILGGDTLSRRQRPDIAIYVDALITLGAAFMKVGGVIKSAYNEIDGLLTSFANRVNDAFGTNVTSGTLQFALALGYVTGAFRLLTSVAALAIPAIEAIGVALAALMAPGLATFLGGLFGPLVLAAFAAGAAIGIFWEDIVRGFSAAKDFIINGWNALTSQIAQIAGSIGAAVSSAIEAGLAMVGNPFAGILSFADSVVGAVRSGFSDLASWVMDTLSSIAAAAGRLMTYLSYGGQQSAPQPGYAEGGYISGPGSGTSDSVFARLSNGEFVIKAATVSAFGADFFHRLNNMQMPSMGFGVPGFADGGLVATAAAGGSASSNRSFTLVIDGKNFGGLTGSDDTIRNLEKYAAIRQLSATAKRAPSRIG